ncbi:hypothetical protein [Streptomyces chryseus]|uniref:hypothetical protein n=1 Tax=Streptomyces chryseus TaxID=68186 RepID=UPI00142EB6DA|nr:hypothetical protein [Streptomyces chryseus]GGX00470.1 hypothetical protein GCM10010353_14920 [Streptomyces chryseus]
MRVRGPVAGRRPEDLRGVLLAVLGPLAAGRSHWLAKVLPGGRRGGSGGPARERELVG